LRLLVRQGQDQGTCYSLLGDLMFIGREDCQIVLNDSNISRKHAEISWKGDHYVIRDLGSQNGIVYNGTKTSQSKLSPGDIVLIGLTVFEVYPSGQTRKNEKPMLPGPVKKLSAVPPPEAAPVNPLNTKEAKEAQKKVERKRMFIAVVVFFLLATAYFNDDGRTFKEKNRVNQVEDVPEPGEKTAKPVDRTEAELERKVKAIQDMKTQLVKLQSQKARLEERAKTMKELGKDALMEPGAPGDKSQRKDSEVFFRNGVRELQNKNYRRAFTAFDTALTVDPTHELAKIYLKSAKMELLSELWSSQVAGLRAKSSLRYKEARMHFENIMRYLENETGGNTSMENEANKELRELYGDAKKELDEIDKMENKDK
jgi:pSer/pThr/pTyr-binding forkhead associated (FHA) protein